MKNRDYSTDARWNQMVTVCMPIERTENANHIEDENEDKDEEDLHYVIVCRIEDGNNGNPFDEHCH
ncbi:MAG TPA: hypothetical protein VGY56_06590 [Verrucomicrobiae bacterium]|nr:hypothetical protein [Verrucomicrobiae bacterium]